MEETFECTTRMWFDESRIGGVDSIWGCRMRSRGCVDIKIMDGREKMTEPKPAAKNGRGANFEISWQLATGNVPDLPIHSTLARVFMQLLWATVET